MRSGTSAVRGPRDGGGVMRLNPISQWTSTWRRQGCPRGGVAEATHSAWQRAVYERNEGGHPRRWWRNEPGTRLRDGLRRGVAMAVLAGDVAEATLGVRATINDHRPSANEGGHPGGPVCAMDFDVASAGAALAEDVAEATHAVRATNTVRAQ
jgi:hypothetical protein